MAGVAEKARFYVERAVPQLREWEDKEIFSKDEIRTIVQKRNDYEHRVLSPGNTPTEWTSYAKWEQTLETLRTKRCRRLKIHHLNSAYAGQARVMSIYERSVTRHPGSGELWREYLAFTAKVKASKRWRKTMTNALRMLPTDSELWIMAGRRSARNGDMAAARGFFMRGCRFCNQDSSLWIEYARCEMEWLQRVEKRQMKGGVDALRPEKTEADDEMRLIESDEDEDEEGDESGAILPRPDHAQAKVIDKASARQLASNPAMDGAIPMAIFDIARKQPFFKSGAGEEFFRMTSGFRDVSAQPRIWQHILDTLDADFAGSASAGFCHVSQSVLGLSPRTVEFPQNLRGVLAQVATQLDLTVEKEALKSKITTWLDEYLALDGLDEGISTVLEHTKGKVEAS